MAVTIGLGGILLGAPITFTQTVVANIAATRPGVTAAAVATVIDAPPTANKLADISMLDASAYTVVTTSVSQVTNRVSSVSWAEATNRPDYEAAGLNSRPCMLFNGTSHRIITTESALFATLTNNAAYTLYVVAKHSATARLEYPVSCGNSTSSVSHAKNWGTAVGTRWRARHVNSAGTVFDALGTVASNTNANIFAWSSDGAGGGATATTLYLNGTIAGGFPATQDTAALTPDRFGLGCRSGNAPTDFFSGRLGAVLLYSGQHSAPTQLAVARYLGNLWGITTA
jgi:hypothetical protein